jgi:hypothetical protein
MGLTDLEENITFSVFKEEAKLPSLHLYAFVIFCVD